MAWHIRHEGSPSAAEVPSARAVLEGLRDGDWEPSDEVRGPADRAWVVIEDHPLFAEAVEEMEPPPPEPPDETRLDMNPLIDVALVLLIFFILTATYATLRRSIDLPPQPPEKEKKTSSMPKASELKDRVVRMKVRMEDGKPVIRMEDRAVAENDVEKALGEALQSSQKKELFLDVSDDVPWGVEARIHDAAKATGVQQIWWPSGK